MARALPLRTRDILKVSKRLEEALESHDGNFCRYKPNHSDTILAAELKITVNQVAKIRRDVYGELEPARRTPADFTPPELLKAWLNDLLVALHHNGQLTLNQSTKLSDDLEKIL